MPKAKNGQKTCPRCYVTKPATIEYFSINKRNKDGLNYICKECAEAERKIYRRKTEALKTPTQSSTIQEPIVIEPQRGEKGYFNYYRNINNNK